MRQVLLLNQSYIPIDIISWRRAVGLVLGRNRAEVVENYQHSYSYIFNAAVIRLTVPSPNPFKLRERQRYSKHSIFVRDRFTCQYCRSPVTLRSGTIDHVIPKSKGGKNHFLNCVTACKPCNFKKDSNTPEQANMPLIQKIRYPNMFDKFGCISIPKEWRFYVKGVV